MLGRTVLVAALAACGHAAPQPVAPATGAITGTVRDQAGDPLSFVSVSARGGGGRDSAATDGGGRFRLGQLPPGRYQVTARWGERSVVSVANLTRADGAEFMKLVATLDLHPAVEPFPLAAGNEALARLKAGQLKGAAVLVPQRVAR